MQRARSNKSKSVPTDLPTTIFKHRLTQESLIPEIRAVMISSERVSSDLAGGSNPQSVSLSGRTNPSFANAQNNDPIYYPHTVRELKSCWDLTSRGNGSFGIPHRLLLKARMSHPQREWKRERSPFLFRRSPRLRGAADGMFRLSTAA